MKKHWRMERILSRFWRDESGQSSFFAALTLFLLLAAIGYSYNVSLVVSRRIRLQNAADAAALSGAMVQANSLAAISWLNGCETYIHARMQEIMLDIPYTATAAATAEWGRYIMNRHGKENLEVNPVEWNHNTNKIGFIGGLWGQIKDLLGTLGGMFSGIGSDGGGEYSKEDKARIEALLGEYYATGTSKDRKDVIRHELMNNYGIDVGKDVNQQTLQEAADRVQAASDAYDAAAAVYQEMSDNLHAKYKNTDFSNCSYAKNIYDMMKKVDANFLEGLDKAKSENTLKYIGSNAYDGLDIPDFTVATSLKNSLRSATSEYNKAQNSVTSAQQRRDYLQSLLDNNQYSDDAEKKLIERALAAAQKEYDAAVTNRDLKQKCKEMLEDMRQDNAAMHAQVQVVGQRGSEYQSAVDHMQDVADDLKGDSVEQDKDAAEKQRQQILKDWEDAQKSPPDSTQDVERDSILNPYNDPPEPWALMKMVPIPVLNPYGPNIFYGRMSPLGTSLADVGIGGDDYEEEEDIVRDEGLADAIKEWADSDEKDSLADGLPPWGELKMAFAGPFGQYMWPYIIQNRYGLDSAPDSMDDFLDFFHNTLMNEARKWIGYRKKNGDSFGNTGIRPGEMWIRQLSQIATAIASAMPRLVRNEVVYSLAVNASPRARVAVYPDVDPDSVEGKAMWGHVAFAQTDAEAGQSFFRYDGWFYPTTAKDKTHWWMPPPNYVNMYTLANSWSPAIRDTVEHNNRAIWTDADANEEYANRFLNESRRQNSRMRTDSLLNQGAQLIQTEINKQLDKLPGFVKGILTKFIDIDELIADLRDKIVEIVPIANTAVPSLSYTTLVGWNDVPYELGKDTGSDGKPAAAFFRMNHEVSFYWDEYAGRVGGWDDTDGPGGPVRVAVKCWNQNDRLWRQPVKDVPNNNKLLLGIFEGLTNGATMVPFTLPIPFAAGHYSLNNFLDNIANRSQLNFNLSPRCQTGYAPGSNVFGLGHAMFVPSHGDPGDAFGAADGHWHFMHYHSHSIGCQVGFPGLGTCYAMVNCIITAGIRFLIDGALALSNDMGPYDRRTGWDSTMHFPYKHWDGTVVDDGASWDGAGDGDTDNAKNRHIYCRVALSNNFKDASGAKVWGTVEKALGHGAERQPPFTILLGKDIISQLVPPISLYAMVGPCPQIHIYIYLLVWVIDITICQHLLEQHLIALIPGETLNEIGLHASESCDSGFSMIMPKDAIPIYNTPVLWNWGDSDPSIVSMWGAQLNRGDMEGDFFMALGNGDRFFYPEILFRLTDAVGGAMPWKDSNVYATGRVRLFTKLNDPARWLGEVLGTGLNLAGDALSFVGKLGFLENMSGGLDSMKGSGDKLSEAMSQLFGKVFDIFGTSQNPGDPKAARNLDYYQTGSIFNEVFATIVDLVTRWGHHRFMTCPLCMSFCPLGCDYHTNDDALISLGGDDNYISTPIRHWGGDYGGAELFDIFPGWGADFDGVAGIYFKAIRFLSFMPGLLMTGDQKSDAGMSYSNVLRGHDYSPAGSGVKHSTERKMSDGGKVVLANWWNDKKGDDTKKDKIPHGNSYFDLGVDLDDGLQGNSPTRLPMERYTPEKDKGEKSWTRAWENSFPMDRFVREWMTSWKTGASRPDTKLAPTVVITENFMRHAVTVAVVEEFVPMLWMFGKSRPLLAVASAKCGFIERPDISLGGVKSMTIDGLGQSLKGDVNPVPQIIAGVGEPDGGDYNQRTSGWDLEGLWHNFLDFPNQRPLGESNLYYGNWGAKMIPTRKAILLNSASADNNRRRQSGSIQITTERDALIKLWTGLGKAKCYRGDGVAEGLLYQQCRMDLVDWREFVISAIDSTNDVFN